MLHGFTVSILTPAFLTVLIVTVPCDNWLVRQEMLHMAELREGHACDCLCVETMIGCEDRHVTSVKTTCFPLPT